MKKSDMTVSMPLTTWEEYEEYKKRYIALTERLAACFDDAFQVGRLAVGGVRFGEIP